MVIKIGRPKCKAREAAIKAGLQCYDTGKPCKKGHYSPRYVSNGACKICSGEYAEDQKTFKKLLSIFAQ